MAKTKDPEIIETGVTKFTSGEIVRLDPPRDPWIGLIEKGLESKADAASMTELYALVKQVKRDAAESAFTEALLLFQSKCPQVFKGRPVRNDSGLVIYNYAGFDDIMREIAPILASCGLTLDFDEEVLENGHRKYTMHVRKGIHTKSNAVVMPQMPTNKMVNPAQAAAQQNAYGCRHALIRGLNIVTTDNDDNDNVGSFDRIGDKSIEMLNNLIEDCEKAGDPVNIPAMLAVKNLKDLGEMLQSDLPYYTDLLTRKHRKALEKKGK